MVCDREQRGVQVKISFFCRLALVCGVLALTGLLSGCVTAGGMYYDGGDIDADYYEYYGPDYGGWGPTYYIAPFREEEHHRHEEFRRDRERHETSVGGHAAPTYRSAPASRPMPSIPSRPRSGSPRPHTNPSRDNFRK